jgi:hypothetical protein
MTTAGSQQRPQRGAVVLDHIANFVPVMADAERALEQLGFLLTPLSHQVHRTAPDAPAVSAGTANRCAMLERGYLEFLTTTGDTPNAAKLRAAMSRYTGVHLACFGTADSASTHERLFAQGFAPPPVVALQREVTLASGDRATLRFSVTRAAPDAMPEGRIQFVEHHTPEHLWEPRWLTHRNGARALTGLFVAVGDVYEAAQRWSRLVDRPAQHEGALRRIVTERGVITLGDHETIARELGVAVPTTPWIAGPSIAVADIDATARFLRRQDLALRRHDESTLIVEAPPALGGIYIFHAQHN